MLKVAQAVLLAVVATACSSAIRLTPIPGGHPADPQAPESAPTAPLADTLGVAQAGSNPPPKVANPDAGDGIPSTYSCPMHSTIERLEPGSCPICGMRLVKSERSTTDEDSR